MSLTHLTNLFLRCSGTSASHGFFTSQNSLYMTFRNTRQGDKIPSGSFIETYHEFLLVTTVCQNFLIETEILSVNMFQGTPNISVLFELV